MKNNKLLKCVCEIVWEKGSKLKETERKKLKKSKVIRVILVVIPNPDSKT